MKGRGQRSQTIYHAHLPEQLKNKLPVLLDVVPRWAWTWLEVVLQLSNFWCVKKKESAWARSRIILGIVSVQWKVARNWKIADICFAHNCTPEQLPNSCGREGAQQQWLQCARCTTTWSKRLGDKGARPAAVDDENIGWLLMRSSPPEQHPGQVKWSLPKVHKQAFVALVWVRHCRKPRWVWPEQGDRYDSDQNELGHEDYNTV